MKELDIHNYLKLFDVFNEDIDKEEKKIIDSFLNILKRRKIDLNNKEDLKLFEDTLQSIFDLEISKYSTGDVKLEIGDNYSDFSKFYFEIDGYISGVHNFKNLVISISKVNKVSSYLNDKIGLRLSAFSVYLRGLFHEIEHYKQLKRLITNVPSLDNLKFALDYAFINYNQDTSNIYDKNHNSFYIENDSDFFSYERLSTLLDIYNTRNIMNCSVKQLNMFLSDIKEDEYNCKQYDIEEYINDKIDNIIRNNRVLLKVFPILLKKYNPNGSRKSLSILYRNMVSDMSKINTYKISDKDKNKLFEDSFNMYYYLLYNKIKNNNTKEIKDLITLIGYDNFVILINNIKESYRKQRISKAKISDRKYDLKYICDKDLNYLKRNQINGFIKYDNVVYQIDDYISKFIKTDEESEISNVLKTYIYPRIPECGYFMLKNGKKILPNDLINSYLVYLLKKDMKLVDVMEVMKGLVLSSREQVHKMELERINANYQRVAITLDNVINRYDKDNQLLGGKVL